MRFDVMDIELLILQLTLLVATIIHCYHYLYSLIKKVDDNKGQTKES